jgi:tryptophan synthase alpha chain
VNRIDLAFAELKAQDRKGLVGYLTAGDPDMETSERNIRTAIDNGLDVLELGMPFSDPTADGPTIQAASFRSLQAGTDLPAVLELVKRLRADYEIPIVLFGYANPLFVCGYEKACADAAAAGVDALLVVDLPFEEAGELTAPMAEHDLCFVPLIAPTTPPERAARVLKNARGFVYYIMVTGVTGARQEVAADVQEHVEALRASTSLPIAVGFGVGNGEQARRAAASADAVVVGSALVKAARDGTLAELVTELRAAL